MTPCRHIILSLLSSSLRVNIKFNLKPSSSNNPTMSTEIKPLQVQDKEVEEHISGADIDTNMDFLRAAGFLPPVTLSAEPEANSDSAVRGLTDAVKALAEDISEKMQSFGRGLEVLESLPAPEVARSAGVLSPSNTSTPEARRDGESTPVVAREKPSVWADRSVYSVPDYEEHITWPDDDDD